MTAADVSPSSCHQKRMPSSASSPLSSIPTAASTSRLVQHRHVVLPLGHMQHIDRTLLSLPRGWVVPGFATFLVFIARLMGYRVGMHTCLMITSTTGCRHHKRKGIKKLASHNMSCPCHAMHCLRYRYLLFLALPFFYFFGGLVL